MAVDYSNVKMIPAVYSSERFALEKKGENPLVVFGFNPSTATDEKPDNTMRSVVKIADSHGYDGFVMLNLYPGRSTSPDALPLEGDITLHRKNLAVIETMLERYPHADVLLAYGNLVFKRGYTQVYAKDIAALLQARSRRVLCIKKLKIGMPKHPLYSNSAAPLSEYVFPGL